MRQILFSFFVLLCFNYNFGYLNEFINVFTPKFRLWASFREIKKPFQNLYDGTIASFETNRLYVNVSDIRVFVYGIHRSGNELRLIRILKTRNGTESLRIQVKFHSSQNNYEMIVTINQGWNDIYINNNKTTHSIYFYVNKTVYDSLELAEIQILYHYKIFHSCLEWKKNLDVGFPGYYKLIDPDNQYRDNVARIEAGATCFSSSGECRNAIKDTVLYIDDLWIPSSKDRNSYIQINFLDKYKLTEIRINQPIENTIDNSWIKNEENLIKIDFNKTFNWTNIHTNVLTKWIKLHLELNKNDENFKFFGIYEIEVYTYKPKHRNGYCLASGKRVTSLEIGAKNIAYTPKTTNKCELSQSYYTDK